MQLEEAYKTLEIEQYPVTKEEVCMQYYKVLLKYNENSEYKERLDEAKKLILTKLSEDPFGRKKITVKLRFSQVLNSIKSKNILNESRDWGEITSQFQSSKGDDVTCSAKYTTKKNHKILKTLLTAAIVLIILGGVLLKEEPLLEEDTGTNMSLFTSLTQMEQDGISIEHSIMPVSKEDIADYNASTLFSIWGYQGIKREFTYHQQEASAAIKVFTLYKNSGEWKKIVEYANYTLLRIDIDGEWIGDYSVTEKYELVDSKLNLQSSKNGYITGEFSFTTEQGANGLIEIEGIYDLQNNHLKMNGNNWIDRPSLFMTPTFTGQYNIATGCLESTGRTNFHFQKKITESNPIGKAMLLHFLSAECATYKDNNIPLESLKYLQYTQTVREDTCEIEYEAVLDRNIIDYNIKGPAQFIKSKEIWQLSKHHAQAECIAADISGIYMGKEYIDNKAWDVTYILTHTDNPSIYNAEVILKRGFKNVKEKREIHIIDGGITTKRLDIVEGNLYGNGNATSYINYPMDNFFNKNQLILTKND